MQEVLLVAMVACVFGGILSGIPVMFVLLGVPLLFATLGSIAGVFDLTLTQALPVRIFGLFENQLLYSVPLFILLGNLLHHSNLATNALNTLARLPGRITARSMVFSVLGVSLVIASSSGIAGATIIMLATIALPVLSKLRVGERLSAGLIVASGSLGQIVPPSIVLILLSDQISAAYTTAQREIGNFAPEPVTIAHLFAGAIIPGLLLAIAYGAYTFSCIPKVHERQTETPSPDSATNQEESAWGGVFALAALVCVPVSILLGIATPTEAAGIGILLIILAALVLREETDFHRALQATIETTGVIFGIIIAASAFALVIRGFDGDSQINALLAAGSDDPYWAVVFVLAIVFIIGFVMEFVEITYVVVPLATPYLFSIGIDPIWFAILLAVNLQISFLTPPMGISLFYYRSVSGIATLELFKAVLPFILLQLVVLVLLFSFPILVTWLPSILI